MTDRIRWEPNEHGGFTGYVGTMTTTALFQILRPAAKAGDDRADTRWDEWALCTTFPGAAEQVRYGGRIRLGGQGGNAPDRLKAEAEHWLEEFVTSLGASFGSPDAIVRWRDVRAGDLVLLDDELTPVESVDICQKPWGDETTFTAVDVGYRLDNGVFVTSERHGDRYTAVRREAGR